MPRPTRRAAIAALVLAALPARAADGPIGVAPNSRDGFEAAQARAFATITPRDARNWLRTLTEEPHVAGTPADHETAVFVRDKLRSWGWEADLVEYQVLLNYPIPDRISLDLVRPDGRKLPVIEEPHAADKDSADPGAWPGWHGYGASGDAQDQVVYANYGRPDDFDALEKLGVPVKGKVVLVRYGGIFRGLKVLNAQRRGAAGLLIYSDPADDGYAKGDVYPDGPYRPESAIQRGSVQFLSMGPGDPSTPGRASTKDAERLPIDRENGFPLHPSLAEPWEEQTGLKRSEYFATIPSLPISYAAARPILEALGGPNVPGGWQGGLPFAYHVGPGPAEVRLSVAMDYQIRPIWNVIATLKGAVEPDRWVILSNHRDAWTYGAVDPGSGTAATLEACRGLGEAVKAGWKPRRTIVYASWDAEEYGLVGSTEWAEDHADELSEKAALLLNVDSAVSGHELDLDGVPSLRDLVLDAAAAVTDPRSGKPLADLWRAARRAEWANAAPLDLGDGPWRGEAGAALAPPGTFAPQMNPLGSGSDYTAFIDHLGIPSVDVNFSGRYGVYHSIYDNFYWMEKFGDPEFLTHATAARLYAAIALRAAGAEVLPMRFVPYAEALRGHVDDLRRTLARRARTAEPGAAPKLDAAELEAIVAAVRRFNDAATAADAATTALAAKDDADPAQLEQVNTALTRVERAFLLESGLPGRPFFKHSIYAPGVTTGYASWPLPGVRQAIEQDDPAMLVEQAKRLVERLDEATSRLEEVERTAKAPRE